MNLLDRIKLLGIVLIMFSCKKQPAPESEYLLERDNKTAEAPNVRGSSGLIYPIKDTLVDQTPTIIYSMHSAQSAFDSIYGYITCVRPNYGKGITTNQGSIYLSETTPLLYISSGIVNHPKGFKLYNSENDPSLIVCEFIYKKKLYKIYTSIGFSNCIIDTAAYKIPYSSGYIKYKIMFEGPPVNTDLIRTCNGVEVPITDTSILLPACGSIANYIGKSNSFTVRYSNFETFKIDGKKFIIDKFALMSHCTAP